MLGLSCFPLESLRGEGSQAGTMSNQGGASSLTFFVVQAVPAPLPQWSRSTPNLRLKPSGDPRASGRTLRRSSGEFSEPRAGAGRPGLLTRWLRLPLEAASPVRSRLAAAAAGRSRARGARRAVRRTSSEQLGKAFAGRARPGERAWEAFRTRTRQGRTGRKASFTSMVRDLARNPTILIFEIFGVIVISIFFEYVEEWCHKKLKKDPMGLALMNVLFKEITLIGFVAFVLFVSLHSGIAEGVATPAVIHSFETVRMIMFLVVLMLVLQAAALWSGGQSIIREWGSFERARSFGESKDSLENQLIRAGYMKRVPDPTGKRRWGLEMTKRWGFGNSLFKRTLRVLSRNRMRKLLIFRAIRHEFLFPSGSETVANVPDPRVFSFESYLAKRLGKILVAMITVDTRTWFSTLALLAVPLFSFKHGVISTTMEEVYVCVAIWGMVLGGMLVAALLEEDTYRMTPGLPADLRVTLNVFNGESRQMLRRMAMPASKTKTLSGKRFRPNLGDAEDQRYTKLERPLAMRSFYNGGRGRLLSTQTYIGLGRLLSHFQAISAAGMIVIYITRIVQSKLEWALYLSSWAIWFFNIYAVLPLILRRITMLSSIEQEKDERAMRIVTLEYKDALLKDFQRLVQVLSFMNRAVAAGEAWTIKGAEWGRREQIQAVVRGNKLFDSLRQDDQMQIWSIYASWDADNSGSADAEEVEEVFNLMKFANQNSRPETVKHLIRLVDFDNTGLLNWVKFKAIFGLATINRKEEEVKEDLGAFFRLLDTDGDKRLSLVELAAGFAGMHISVSAVDVENLLFTYYGVAKPEITEEEFVSFISADNRMAAIRSFYDYGPGVPA